MTQYVLAGGCDRRYPDFGKRLADFVRREVAQPVILSCFFSQPVELRSAKHQDFAPWFAEYFPFAKEIVSATEDNFFEQVKKCDVIYLHGGHTRILMDSLPDFDAVKAAFEGKIVIGSSAGANYLAQTSYSPHKDSVQRGSGILDLAVVVHYGMSAFEEKTYKFAQWRSAAHRVKVQAGTAPVVLLPEGNFTVIEQ